MEFLIIFFIWKYKSRICNLFFKNFISPTKTKSQLYFVSHPSVSFNFVLERTVFLYKFHVKYVHPIISKSSRNFKEKFVKEKYHNKLDFFLSYIHFRTLRIFCGQNFLLLLKGRGGLQDRESVNLRRYQRLSVRGKKNSVFNYTHVILNRQE